MGLLIPMWEVQALLSLPKTSKNKMRKKITDFYTIKARCKNCRVVDYVKILKGRSIRSGRCSICGCGNLTIPRGEIGMKPTNDSIFTNKIY